MRIVVQKYGGSSVATVEKLRSVAEKVVNTRRSGVGVVVVVSAMGDTTDDLLQLVREVSESPSRREMDMLLSVGERISMALLSIAIQNLGEEAISLTGSQCGILTTHSHANARIVDVRPFRVQDELEAGRIVIVAGFQGTSYKREVTTLGRGGSDTTAVALAAALGAEHCDIYSDVPGVFSADPRIVPDATRLAELSYEEMQEMARQGARVLNAQAVEFARERRIAIHARATSGDGEGTVIRRIDPDADARVRQLRNFGARGVAGRRDLVLLSYEVPSSGENRGPDMLDELDGFDLLLANSVPGLSRLDILATTENVPDAPSRLRALQQRYPDTLTIQRDLGSASVIGLGIGEHPGAMLRLHRTLEAEALPLTMTFTAREAITAVLPVHHVERAQRLLHAAFIEAD
ncbi:MAG: aspartate kinase [Deltaproteobacteria bacterium]|nr:MAG: aspartate kinase [Deltaproteobacteria bacterium]